MCQLVDPPINPAHPVACRISFAYLSLQPDDCFSIGYFMSHQHSCGIDVECCQVSESGMEALLSRLNKSPVTNPNPSHASLKLCDNLLTTCGTRLLSTALRDPSHLSQLAISSAWPHSQVATHLTCLIEGLSRRSSAIAVTITSCNVTSEHVHLLVLLITTCHCIDELGLQDSDINEGMPLVVKAFELNTTLKVIWLSECNVGDESLTELGKRIPKTVDFIQLARNPFSSRALISFLKSQFHSRLRGLDIGRPLNEEEEVVYHQLHQYRAVNFMPTLTVVEGFSKLTRDVRTAMKTLDSLPQHVRSRLQD